MNTANMISLEQRADLKALLKQLCPKRTPTYQDMLRAGWTHEVVVKITGQREWLTDPTGNPRLEWNGHEWCYDNEDWMGMLPTKRTQWDHICSDIN